MLKEKIAELIHKRMAGSCCWETAHKETKEHYYKLTGEILGTIGKVVSDTEIDKIAYSYFKELSIPECIKANNFHAGMKYMRYLFLIGEF